MAQINLQAFDIQSLFRRVDFTDDKSGTLTQLIPVFIDETGRLVDDPLRTVLFRGLTYINNQPFPFEIQADTVREACEKFSAAIALKISDLQGEAVRSRIANPGPIPPNGPLIVDPASKPR
jgi:hypothetical protein